MKNSICSAPELTKRCPWLLLFNLCYSPVKEVLLLLPLSSYKNWGLEHILPKSYGLKFCLLVGRLKGLQEVLSLSLSLNIAMYWWVDVIGANVINRSNLEILGFVFLIINITNLGTQNLLHHAEQFELWTLQGRQKQTFSDGLLPFFFLPPFSPRVFLKARIFLLQEKVGLVCSQIIQQSLMSISNFLQHQVIPFMSNCIST